MRAIIEGILNKEIEENKVDIVLTGGLSYDFSRLKNIVSFIRKKFFHIKIIVGGAIITADPGTAMIALEYADIGVIGEGEITVVELRGALQKEMGVGVGVAGIIYMDNGDWVQSKPREEINDLDSLPFPDYDGFGADRYLELSFPPRPSVPAQKADASPKCWTALRKP